MKTNKIILGAAIGLGLSVSVVSSVAASMVTGSYHVKVEQKTLPNNRPSFRQLPPLNRNDGNKAQYQPSLNSDKLIYNIPANNNIN